MVLCVFLREVCAGLYSLRAFVRKVQHAEKYIICPGTSGLDAHWTDSDTNRMLRISSSADKVRSCPRWTGELSRDHNHLNLIFVFISSLRGTVDM